MRRAVIAAILVASGTAAADEPAVAEDPKQAIRDRGIVLKASKKHYVIIVPAAEPPKDSVLGLSTIYFGELRKLRLVAGTSYSTPSKDSESRKLSEERGNYLAELERKTSTYAITCTAMFTPDQAVRRIPLAPVSDKAATTAIQAARIIPAAKVYAPFLVARIGTSYLYVDRHGVEGTDYRVFLGKRGAMKRVAVKDIASDSDALVLETAKGMLTVPWKDMASATWGTKTPAPLATLAIGNNRGLIRDLGIYTREPSGHPCDEL